MKRRWFLEHGGIWQVDSQANAYGADIEIRRHLMCRAGDALALAFNPASHRILKFGPRAMVEHWIAEADRAAAPGPQAAHLSIVTFLASAETVARGVQGWEQGGDVRVFVGLLRGVDRLRP